MGGNNSERPERGDAAGLYREHIITTCLAGLEPIEVVDAKGCWISAADGRRYLDGFSGIAVVNAGHGHPKVNAAAKRQIDQLVHCCSYLYHSPATAGLAADIAAITPKGLRQSFFGNSGAEAVEGALRLAKHHTGKHEFIALGGGFHGRTNMTLSVTGIAGRKAGGGPYHPGVAFAPAPYFYRCPFGTKSEAECAERAAAALDDVIAKQTSGAVAAMIAEPVLGEGGIIVPHESYFRLVKQILESRGIMFIADEVQTGFGRTGAMFAIEHYGVIPDIITMAKGIANGFPLGAFTTRPEIAKSFTPGSHLSTFGGNPVSCAAARATIEVIQEENLAANAAARGAEILASLRNPRQPMPLLGDIRGKGLMIGVELVTDPRDKRPAPEAAREARRRCREKGVLVGLGGPLGNILRLQPPLSISPEESEQLVDTLTTVLAEITRP